MNNLTTKLSEKELTNSKEIIDEVFDILVLSYVYGNRAANIDLNSNELYKVDTERLGDTVYKKIDGKTFSDRITEYAKDTDENGNLTDKAVEEINRVIETESHRCYNEGLFEVAEMSGANKTWATMLDDKVRESHAFLEGVTVAWDERFYTENDSALYPGGFETAELNCNCRCEIILSK